MYDELVKRLRELPHLLFVQLHGHEDVVYKAADAIEELQQTAEHYKGCADDWYKEACDYQAILPRWVPVTERLPEDEKSVVVWSAETTYSPSFMTFGIWRREWGRWDSSWDDEELSCITHWMPLPEPPKEEG